MLGVARKFFLDKTVSEAKGPERFDPPRLTPDLLENHRMSRSRERILANLEEMYREAFDRAKSTGDDAQLVSLDFAFRREQLYFEILLDMRDAAVEAYEGVEKGLMTEADFRDFVFTNPVKLHCGMNPQFFEGTILQDEAREVMAELSRTTKTIQNK
jgi:hypothetical protein